MSVHRLELRAQGLRLDGAQAHRAELERGLRPRVLVEPIDPSGPMGSTMAAAVVLSLA
jgi:hypothetical protein